MPCEPPFPAPPLESPPDDVSPEPSPEPADPWSPPLEEEPADPWSPPLEDEPPEWWADPAAPWECEPSCRWSALFPPGDEGPLWGPFP